MHLMRISRILVVFLFIVLFLNLVGCASNKNTPALGGLKPVATMKISPVRMDSDTEKEYRKALAYMKSAKFQRAERAFKKILEKKTGVAAVHANLGLIYLKQDRLLDAEMVVKEGLSKNSMRPELYNLLGVILRNQGRFQEAETSYLYALQIDDGYANAHMNIGILYDLYMMEFVKARQHYQKYMAIKPEQSASVSAWLVDMQQRSTASN